MSALPITDDFPTIRAELERKTMEECERLIHALKTRQISGSQFASSMQTLWTVVSGLVDKELMDMITAVLREPARQDGSGKVVEVLRKGADVVVIRTEYGSTRVTVDVCKADGAKVPTQFDFKDAVHPGVEAFAELEQLSSRFKSAGFVPV